MKKGKTALRRARSMGLVLCLLLAGGFACREEAHKEENMKRNPEPVVRKNAPPPARPLALLFIHHSCGGQLLAEKGSREGKDSIYTSHPNGGGLRRLLEENNYVVHEASYGSDVGENTDVCHWHAKFKGQMDAVLRTKMQNETLEDGAQNHIVMFKSCYPNSWIDTDGQEPGNPDACAHTTANYKAAYQALLPAFAERPDTLFIAVTAPPLAQPKGNVVKNLVKRMLGRDDVPEKVGPRIRGFNNWLKDGKAGWLSGYPLDNVVVFDMYEVLTGHGQSNWSVYPTEGGTNSHPSSEGNQQVAAEFIPFLNQAVDRMGLAKR